MKEKLAKLINGVIKAISITISIDPDHPMVILKNTLDWEHLEQIYLKHRKKKIKSNAGKKPRHITILIAAVIVRILESCTLRKAQDLMRYYAPARYLCGLNLLTWTPNFRTLWDFEIMLGKEGLKEINDYILKIAKEAGFIDIKGLCADTTAQEAQIPYPSEVGLMGSLVKSIGSAIGLLKGKITTNKDIILAKISKIKKLVRKHRLFCKTLAAKRKVEKELLQLSNTLCSKVKRAVTQMSSYSIKNLKGHQKTAYSKLLNLVDVFNKLSPQINYYIKNGTAISGKIISLYQPLLRAIVRGKAGKKVEFGIKWGINQFRGGYISLFLMNGTVGEAGYAVEGVKRHIKLFGKAPVEYGYDRGGWSEKHIEKIEKLGVKRIGIAPKGKAKWKVSKQCQNRITKERAQVEGKIGTIKNYGFNKPNAKTISGMERSAHRSGIRFNITKLVKDMSSMKVITK